MIFTLWLLIPGFFLMFASLFGWALEPADDLGPVLGVLTDRRRRLAHRPVEPLDGTEGGR